MEPSSFDEIAFFRAVARSGARALLIGRRALVLLGLPRIGRYVLENDEHVDVLVARSLSTLDGCVVEFESLWKRRRAVSIADVEVYLPALDDLILTKQVAARPKDVEDIRLLRILKEHSQ